MALRREDGGESVFSFRRADAHCGKWAYHWTTDGALKSIGERGLQPSSQWKRIFFCATGDAYSNGVAGQWLLRFLKPKDTIYVGAPSHLDPDAYTSTQAVLPQDLEIKTRLGWKPLRDFLRVRRARAGRATGFKLAPWETRALVRSYANDIKRAKRLTALKRVLAYVKGHPFEFKETTKGRVEHLIYLEQSGHDSTQSRISQDVLKAMLAVDARAYPLAAEAMQPVVARRVMSIGRARGRKREKPKS